MTNTWGLLLDVACFGSWIQRYLLANVCVACHRRILPKVDQFDVRIGVPLGAVAIEATARLQADAISSVRHRCHEYQCQYWHCCHHCHDFS